MKKVIAILAISLSILVLPLLCSCSSDVIGDISSSDVDSSGNTETETGGDDNTDGSDMSTAVSEIESSEGEGEASVSSEPVVSGDIVLLTEMVELDGNREGNYPIKSLTINGVDISEYQIVYADTASISTAQAALELQYYIRLASGAKLGIVISAPDVIGEIGRMIYLDDTAFDDEESFSIKTQDENLIISGSGVRGVIYGAFEFLERYVGWRYLTTTTGYVICSDELDISNIDYLYTPYFEYRDSYWTSYFNPSIASKRKINSGSGREMYGEIGGSIEYSGSSSHTFAKLTGGSSGEQPCLSDPAVFETALANVLAILEGDPDARMVSVSQNDNIYYCTCDQCAAVDAEEGSHAGSVIRFVNKIADAVSENYPNVMIHTLAYGYSRTPPSVTKPRDNVIVQLCSIECCYNHALDDPTCEDNVSFKNDLIKWSEICDNLYIWDYTTNFSYYLAPFPNFDVLLKNAKLFCDYNVKGVFEQGNYQTMTGEFSELRAYLLAQVLWNPYMTEEEYYTHMDDFLLGYYGDGWEYIRQYIDFMIECGNKQGHFGIYSSPDTMIDTSEYYNRYQEIDEWFDAAESLAGTSSQLSHVQRARLSFSYVKLNVIYNNPSYETDENLKAIWLEESERFAGSFQAHPMILEEGDIFPTEETLQSLIINWK